MRWIKRLFKTKERADRMPTLLDSTTETVNAVKKKRAHAYTALRKIQDSNVIHPHGSHPYASDFAASAQKPIKIVVETIAEKKSTKPPRLHEVSCISNEEAEENRKKLKKIYDEMPK